jgi:hypothetical protein
MPAYLGSNPVKKFLKLALVLWAAALLPVIVVAASVDVRDHGAVGDGTTPATIAIQAAIDRVHRAGGGVVRLVDGVYLSGTVQLRSGVTLRVEEGAVLRGVGPGPGTYPPVDLGGGPDPVDDAGTGPRLRSGLVVARDARNVGVEGRGVIDGNGLAFPVEGVRPSALLFVRCEDVRVEDITTRASGFWAQHYAQCTRIEIRRTRVEAHLPDQNNDGIDFSECHQVRLTDSTIIADDDAIVLKSRTSTDRGSRDILVENCTVYSRKSAFKIGTESLGPFENITVRNLTVYGSRGINLYSVDGGQIRNVLVENVTIHEGYAALLMHVGDRRLFARSETGELPPPGGMENIVVRNLHATFAERSFRDLLTGHGIALHGPAHEKPMKIAENFISGLRDHPITNVRLENITLKNLPGGGTQAGVLERVPENSDHYPLQGMFGRLPAWALYLRHVHNITIDNLVLETSAADERPALLADGVVNLDVGAAVARGKRFEIKERSVPTVVENEISQ